MSIFVFLKKAAFFSLGIVKQFFLSRSGNRSTISTFILTGLIASLTLFFNSSSLLSYHDYISGYGSSVDQLILAINKKICNTSYLITSKQTLPLRKNTMINKLSVIDIPSLVFKSNDAYCATLTVPDVRLSSSLGWTFSLILHFKPDITAQELSYVMTAVGLFFLVIFLFFLLRVNFSPFLSFCCFYGSISILCELTALLSAFDAHVLFQPALAGCVGLFGICFSYKTYANCIKTFCSMALCGAFCFYVYNLRTSYIFILLLLIIGWLFFSFKIYDENVRNKKLKKLSLLLVSLVGFLLPWFFLQYVLIHNPIMQLKKEIAIINSTRQNSEAMVQADYSEVNHTVIHPLVLALAVPENSFSNELGLQWNDDYGLKAAQTIDPKVTWQNGYYQCLWKYYFGLWKKYPYEMLSTYSLKLKIAGKSVLAVVAAKEDKLFYWALLPMNILINGYFYLLLFLGLFILSVVRFHQLGENKAFALFCLSSAGLSVLLESIAIFSWYNAQFDGYLLVWLLFISVLFWELILRFVFRLGINLFLKSGKNR